MQCVCPATVQPPNHQVWLNIHWSFSCFLSHGGCRGRVVKAMDLKSIGLCPHRFEPCRQRSVLSLILKWYISSMYMRAQEVNRSLRSVFVFTLPIANELNRLPHSSTWSTDCVRIALRWVSSSLLPTKLFWHTYCTYLSSIYDFEANNPAKRVGTMRWRKSNSWPVRGSNPRHSRY